MCAEINYLIPLLLLLHYEVKVVHQVLGWIIYFFNTGTLFEMSTCHLNFFHLWHNGTFFCHILWVKNGSGKTREMRTRGQKWKKKKESDSFIFIYCINVWLVEEHYLFVKIIDWFILFMAKNHKQMEQSCVLRLGMIAMCTFLFVLYNVNMIISKLTFWDMVGFRMKV